MSAGPHGLPEPRPGPPPPPPPPAAAHRPLVTRSSAGCPRGQACRAPAPAPRSLGPLVVGADLTRVVAAKTNTAALVVRGRRGQGHPSVGRRLAAPRSRRLLPGVQLAARVASAGVQPACHAAGAKPQPKQTSARQPQPEIILPQTPCRLPWPPPGQAGGGRAVAPPARGQRRHADAAQPQAVLVALHL